MSSIHHAVDEDAHDDFGGLHRDALHQLDRRQALRWMGGLSLVGLLQACGSGGDGASSTTVAESTTTSTGAASTSAASTTTAATSAPATTTVVAGETEAGAEIPDETAGPFPADGTNGPNVLGLDGIVRSDITTSIGDLIGIADGVRSVVQLTVVEADTGDPVPGAVVYLWHCTADGRYSLYEIEDQNYLRGVQVTDDAGRLSFTTVFPGCYAGRWPHCHFEVYDDLDAADSGRQATKTSQLALPRADCEVVYADASYGNSLSNLGRLSLSSDGVFRDGWDDQLATVAGSLDDGFTASLLVRV